MGVKMIVKFDENTFGKRKKYISTTKCLIRCDRCKEKEWWTFWTYRKKRKHDYCQSCKNTLGISGMKGKHHSEEMKEAASKRNSGDNNPSKNPEVRKKISAKLKGRKVPWLKGKKRPEHSKIMKAHMAKVWDENNDDYAEERKSRLLSLAKSRQKIRNSHYNGCLTKLHQSVKEYLTENGFSNFKSEENIDRYFVDELDIIKKFIIEVYGDYWHANPTKFNADDILNFPGNNKITAKEVWEQDNKRIYNLKQLGYQVFVIWETDWNEDKDEILIQLTEVYLS